MPSRGCSRKSAASRRKDFTAEFLNYLTTPLETYDCYWDHDGNDFWSQKLKSSNMAYTIAASMFVELVDEK